MAQRIKRKGRPTAAVIVDGETEMWYLQMLQRNEPGCKLTIKPELPKHKTLKEQFEDVQQNARIYDKSIWIVDLDKILEEDRQSKKGIADNFNKYLKKLESNKKVRVYIIAPCLEYWFLLHFKDTGQLYPDGDSVIKELKKHPALKDYNKTQKYFTGSNDIYKRLLPYLDTAINNGGKRGDYEHENPHQAKAEIFKLFAELGIR